MKALLTAAAITAFSSLLNAQGGNNQLAWQQRVTRISDRIFFQKNNAARTQMYQLYSNYLVNNNIYPNEDAIDLVEAYNKQASYDDIQSNRVDFKVLQLKPLTEQQMNYRRQQYKIVANEMLLTNKLFNKAANNFNSTLPTLARSNNLPGTFLDSLTQFGKGILPAIQQKADIIPSLQQKFFLVSLNQINQLAAQLINGYDSDAHAAVRELMEDFYAYPVGLVMQYQNHRNTGFKNAGKGLYRYASYNSTDFNDNYLQDDETELPNADVYVYGRAGNGKWSQEPLQDSFNVYFGANGLKYSLKPGVDTLQLFSAFHPSRPASVLPVVLPKGKVCFVLQNVNTGKLLVKPDINLRDNKDVDDKQLIKLCFKIEN